MSLGTLKYHVDGKVSIPNHAKWRLTCVYGEAQVGERYITWDLLKPLASASPLPWLRICDFNEVLHPHEHARAGQCGATQIHYVKQWMYVP